MATTLNNRTVRQDDWSAHLVAQATQDTIPTSPVFTAVHLRTSGTALETPTYEQSSAITSTGQPRDNIKTGSDLAFEMATEYNDQHKTLLSAGMESDITDNSFTASTVAFTATGLTTSGTEFSVLEAGDFVFVSGATNSALDRAYLVTDVVSSGEITTNPVPAALESAGATITVASYKMALGKAPTLYTVQNRVIDASQAGGIAYETFYNGFTNTYALEVPEQGIITSTLAMVFEKKLASLAKIAGQTDAALSTSEPSTTPLIGVWLDDVESTDCFLKNISLSIEHGYTGNSVAQCENKRQAKGIPTVGGSVSTVMFSDDTYYWKNLANNGTPVKLAFSIDFKDGKKMVIAIPRLKPTSWAADGDTALSNNMDFSCEADGDTAMSNNMDFSCEADRTTNIALYAFTNF